MNHLHFLVLEMKYPLFSRVMLNLNIEQALYKPLLVDNELDDRTLDTGDYSGPRTGNRYFFKPGLNGQYPLAMANIAIEHGH